MIYPYFWQKFWRDIQIFILSYVVAYEPYSGVAWLLWLLNHYDSCFRKFLFAFDYEIMKFVILETFVSVEPFIM